MEKAVRALAPAKINLHLRVYGRRSDGFHGIRSVFQAISLADELVVRSLKQPECFEIDGVFDCPPEETTFYKATVAFRQVTGIHDGLSVTVNKAIPAGAGLGGGSSDAAAYLMALDALFETGLSADSLAAIAASVGSDVPFFLVGGAALVSGRGETVKAIVAREDYAVVVVFPGFAVSTKEAYGLLDRERPLHDCEADLDDGALISAYSLQPDSWPFWNSFETYVGTAHPAILSWIGRLKATGALFSLMSGSGSAVFGVFADLEKAQAAAIALKALNGDDLPIVAAFPLARVPCLL
jgi:4-diphosphocytidyl-2-C-methyl-D-erythritol kinase